MPWIHHLSTMILSPNEKFPTFYLTQVWPLPCLVSNSLLFKDVMKWMKQPTIWGWNLVKILHLRFGRVFETEMLPILIKKNLWNTLIETPNSWVHCAFYNVSSSWHIKDEEKARQEATQLTRLQCAREVSPIHYSPDGIYAGRLVVIMIRAYPSRWLLPCKLGCILVCQRWSFLLTLRWARDKTVLV